MGERFKMWSRLFMMLILAMSLAACSSAGGNEGSEGSEGASSGGEFDEHMEISVALWDLAPAMQNGGQDELIRYVQEKFNMTIKPVALSWDDYADKIKIWAASGQLPDIFSINLNDSDMKLYEKWAKQGIIRALPEDMSAYPSLQRTLEAPDVKTMLVDGKYYMYPRMTYPTSDDWATDRAMLVRKDWMEKLGISEPETFEDFKEMLRRFVKEDPDGNGKPDTIGVIGWDPSYYNYLTWDIVPQIANNGWLQEDGKWIPYYMSKEYPKSLERLRGLYDEGLLYRDFLTEKNAVDTFAQGKSGVFIYSVTPMHLIETELAWKKYNEGQAFADAVSMLKPIADEDGKRYRYSYLTFWSESYFAKKVSDKKMDRILRLYDYLVSEEGKRLFMYGIEGKDYVMENGSVKVTRNAGKSIKEEYPSLTPLASLAAWNQEQNFIDNEANGAIYGEHNLRLSLASKEWLLEHAEAIPTRYDINTLGLKNLVPGIMSSQEDLQVIVSEDDVGEAWTKVIGEFKQKGLDEMVEAVNKQAGEQGLK